MLSNTYQTIKNHFSMTWTSKVVAKLEELYYGKTDIRR